MHLLLGDPQDSWCMLISSVLKARNYPYRFILNPLVHPSRFVWRLDSSQSVSQVIWEGEAPMLNDQISSVLVRRTMGWIDPNGWQPDDFAYMQAEMQASLLAWLWSLNCPVINRYPAAIWCRPEVPLLYWQPLLRSCGLNLPIEGVIIQSQDMKYTATTNAKGHYRISRIAEGTYTFNISCPGYNPLVKVITFAAGTASKVDLQMENLMKKVA